MLGSDKVSAFTGEAGLFCHKSPPMNTELGHSYGWHVGHSLTSKRFKSKDAAVAAVTNFETEFNPYDRGWIISGPGYDGKFRVHQGAVHLLDVPELMRGDGVWLVLDGEVEEFKN